MTRYDWPRKCLLIKGKHSPLTLRNGTRVSQEKKLTARFIGNHRKWAKGGMSHQFVSRLRGAFITHILQRHLHPIHLPLLASLLPTNYTHTQRIYWRNKRTALNKERSHIFRTALRIIQNLKISFDLQNTYVNLYSKLIAQILFLRVENATRKFWFPTLKI